MEWSNTSILKLIEMYRDRPVLWDFRLLEYKDRNKHHDAFMEIVVAFETDKTKIEKKIKSLLTVFAREVRKEKDSHKSGAGTDEVYVSKWYCYKTLLFLKDRNTVRNSTDTETGQTVTGEEEENSEVIDDPPLGNPETIEGANSRISHKRLFGSPRKGKSPLKCRKRVSELAVQSVAMANEALSLMKDIKESQQGKDEYSLFGEQIAFKIQKLSTDHAKIMVQHKINNIMFDAKMGRYNYPADSPSYMSSHTTPYYSPMTPLRFYNPSLPYQSYPSPSQYSSVSQYSPPNENAPIGTCTPQYPISPATNQNDVSHSSETGETIENLL